MRTIKKYRTPYFYDNGLAELNTSNEIKEIQAYLISKGFDLGSWGADGVLGNRTKQAIYNYFKNYYGVPNPITPKVPTSSLTVQVFKEVFAKKGYVFYSGDLQLNIIGIRNLDANQNLFDDQLFVVWNENGQTRIVSYAITTDPGSAFLGSKMGNENGTAILKEGQYVNAYTIGYHRGKYKALVQRGGEVTVIRDNNQDNKLDFHGGKAYTGYFGINIHKAAKDSTYVNDWSAGCQVFKKEIEFNEFISLCEKSASKYGSQTKFTYSLLEISKGVVQ